MELIHEAGIIEQLDFYMLEESCKQLEEWKRQGYGDLWLSCNFTRTSISENDFTERFKKITEQYEFCHEKLWVEITEDSISEKDEMMLKNITACKNMGFVIVLDDFGSGYSSLKDLFEYPLDCIKVDKEIIKKSVRSEDMKLLKAISGLVHEMNMKVLYEGVETEEESRQLEEIPCEYMQGYYYSRVLPKEYAMEYLIKFIEN